MKRFQSCAKAQRLVTAMALCLFFLCAGCIRLSDGVLPPDWYTAYQPLEHPDSAVFLSNALVRVTEEFGGAVIPVKQVKLYRSRRLPDERRYFAYHQDFSSTLCTDATNGVFVILMGFDPDHQNYYGVFGHECGHLLNADIKDWYMEGLVTVFSEELLVELGKAHWKRNFMRSRYDPYARSYQMMKALKQACPDEYPTIVRFAVPREDGRGEGLRIDIDAWLATLPEVQRTAALEIIAQHAKFLRKNVGVDYAFTIPEAL